MSEDFFSSFVVLVLPLLCCFAGGGGICQWPVNDCCMVLGLCHDEKGTTSSCVMYWLLKSRTPPRATQELRESERKRINRKIRMLISKKIRSCLVSHFSFIPILLRRTFYVQYLSILCLLAQPSTSQPTTDTTTTHNPDANEPLLRQSLVTSHLPSTSIAAT